MDHISVLSVCLLLYPLSYTQTGATVRVQRVLNSSIAFSRGLLSPISTHFCLSAMLCCILPFPFSCWVGALVKTCTLCADNSTSCLCGNPIYLSALKQRWFFCAFLCDKDSHLGTGLCFDRQRWGGWGGGRGKGREGVLKRSENTQSKQSEWWKHIEC